MTSDSSTTKCLFPSSSVSDQHPVLHHKPTSSVSMFYHVDVITSSTFSSFLKKNKIKTYFYILSHSAFFLSLLFSSTVGHAEGQWPLDFAQLVRVGEQI